MARFSHWIALVGVAGLLAGCGSSHGTMRLEVGGNPPPSFREVLNGICSPANHQGVRLGGRKWAAEEQGYLRKLTALAAPESEQATYARFLATFQTVIDGYGANNPAALRATIENQKLRHRLHAPDCGLPNAAF